MVRTVVAAVVAVAVWGFACLDVAAGEPEGTGGIGMALTLTSTAFDSGEAIPRKYSCDGQDISPPLSWDSAPKGTESFVIVCDDPDAPAGTWDHWIVYNIAASVDSLAEGVSPGGGLPDGCVEGENSWGRADYGGPCPPGGTHRYMFRLYALDTVLDLGSRSVGKKLVEKGMEGHILAQSELMGTYSRR